MCGRTGCGGWHGGFAIGADDLRLPSLMLEDLDCTRKIGSFWDTLGWVDFRMGNLDEAESYLQSAWLLSQMAVVADHLGQLYEQEKKIEKAMHMYRLAVATPDGRSATGDEPQKHLERLGEKVPMTMTQKIRSGEELSQLRTIKLKESESAPGHEAG